jgi:hypothetical protein
MKNCPISANFGPKAKMVEFFKLYFRLIGMVKKLSQATVPLRRGLLCDAIVVRSTDVAHRQNYNCFLRREKIKTSTPSVTPNLPPLKFTK